MAFVDENDVQVHLPIDKLKVEDIPDSFTQVSLDVERIIRGHLSGTFAPLTLAGWAAPDDTPEYIRSIGGRLAAALIYRLRLAQDYPDDSEYAIQKYNEAMTMLNNVVLGLVTLPEVEEAVDTGGHLTTGHYNELPAPKFSMESVF